MQRAHYAGHDVAEELGNQLAHRFHPNRQGAGKHGRETAVAADEMMICCKRQGTKTHLDDRLKDLMKELGDAINESLSDSDRIAAAIGEIKRAGYDVFLVLEATIGFNKREDNEDDAPDEGETVELESTPESGRRKLSKIKLTSQDQKFLRALKISIDEEKH